MDTIGFQRHNHHDCIAEGVALARLKCEASGRRLTPLRQRVLEILLEHHRAIGAYEVLDRLREDGLPSQPPVAYRALEFLVANGFAHRIERLNAFIACSHSGEDHAPAFLICRSCKSVAETPSAPMRGQLGRVAKQADFIIESTVVEAEGVCPNCRCTQ